jgi:hypothetical protein
MADHPITPPPELFKQWESMPRSAAIQDAYRAGAEMQLMECCSVLHLHDGEYLHPYQLLAACRPNPPSLAEQALTLLDDASTRLDAAHENTIRRALERLQELEGGNG